MHLGLHGHDDCEDEKHATHGNLPVAVRSLFVPGKEELV